MSSISINRTLNKRTRKLEQKSANTTPYPIFSLMVLIIVLGFAGLSLFAQPSTALASSSITPQTLSLSGALTSRITLEDATVTCSSTAMNISGTFPLAYSLNFTNGDKAVSSNLNADGVNTLNFSINSATAGVPSSVFSAYDGTVFVQNGRSYINASLMNESGQPLYINATVACN